ncbi:MAG: YeeE/YedE family protein [Planctomycetes bacterium]|nr:YeeE/YedE family protein [Planctomycetota bacterium]
MNLYQQGLLDTPLGFALALAIGLAFGFWLERAGFGSSRKLAGIFYLRDFAVLQVMFSALVTAAIGLWVLDAGGWIDASSVYRMETRLAAQITGGLLFGAGFVTGGWCPGTALVGAASGKLDALVFLGGAMGGSLVYAALWPVVAPLQELGACGIVALPEWLHLSTGVTVALVLVLALGAFAGAHKLSIRNAHPQS